jgi:hypothetical protein
MNGMIEEENFFDRLEKDIKQYRDENHLSMQLDQNAVHNSEVLEQDTVKFF